MADRGFWSRLKSARLVRVLAVYLGASWVLLQVVEVLQEALSLPDWVMPVALILLAVGFLVVLATAWIQSHPTMEAREAAKEVPDDWDLALSGVKEALARGEIPHPNWARALAGGVFVFSLLFGAAGLYVVVQDRGESFQPPPVYAGESAPSVAVLPFRISGAELEEWEEGLVDLLSTGLDGVAGLRAVDSRTILSRWDGIVGDAVRPDLATSLGVAAAAGARFVLEGSVVSMGDAVRLVAQVHDLESGARVGTAQVQGSLEAPHDLVDRLCMEVLQILLGGEARDLPAVDLAAVTTTSTEALKAYLRGERHYREGRFEDAIDAYNEAVAIDPTFALAHHRLFLAVGWVGFAGSPLQRRHGDRALALVDRLPERERLLVRGTYRMTRSENDPAALETTLEEAVELYPNDAEAWYLLAETYFHEARLNMPPAELEEILERAIELDPSMAAYRIHHVEYAFNFHGDSALAARRVSGYRDVADRDDPILHRFEVGMELAFGDSAARAAALDRFFRSSPDANDVAGIGWLLSGVTLVDPEEAFLRRALSESAADDALPLVVSSLVRTLAARGKVSEAVELLDHPALSGPGMTGRRCRAFDLTFAYPDRVPDERLEAILAESGGGAGDGSPRQRTLDAFCGAGIAVHLGSEEALSAERGRLGRIQEWAAGQDSVLARELRGADRFPDALWRWKREGQPAEAVTTLEAVGFPSGAVRGDLYRELGRIRDAEEAYRADFQNPVAWYRLAGIYEERGDTARARGAWERVAAAWQSADPELQQRVEEARARLAALP